MRARVGTSSSRSLLEKSLAFVGWSDSTRSKLGTMSTSDPRAISIASRIAIVSGRTIVSSVRWARRRRDLHAPVHRLEVALHDVHADAAAIAIAVITSLGSTHSISMSVSIAERTRAGYPAGLPRGKKGTRVNIKKVTPLLVVDRIEPSLRFYEKLGYTAVISVPHDDHLGFVLLAQDVGQIMLQTRSSLAADLPAISRTGVSSLLYVDVESLEEALIAAAGSSEILVPMRTTAYGAREAFVREPSGQIVGFAEEVPKLD